MSKRPIKTAGPTTAKWPRKIGPVFIQTMTTTSRCQFSLTNTIMNYWEYFEGQRFIQLNHVDFYAQEKVRVYLIPTSFTERPR